MKVLNRIKSDVVLTIECFNEKKAERGLYFEQPAFRKSFSFVVKIGQFMGLMPISVSNSNDNVLQNVVQFKWKSFRMVYTLLSLFGSLLNSIFCIVKFALDGFMLDKTATTTFYILNFLGTWQFVEISKNWYSILKEWSLVEMSMRGYPSSSNVDRRIKLIAILILGIALAEHLLFILNALITSQQCENYSKWPAEIYFGVAFPHVFTLIEYSHWKAILVEAANVLSTCTWNFTDLFIMLISCSLALRFRQIADKLQANKIMHVQFFREIREDYNKVSKLCSVVDKHLAQLVMISFINNTFFICIQLYNSLKRRVLVIESVYFFFSFGTLLTRTLAVSIYGAWINDESRRPLQMLHSVPSEHYTTEVSRFVHQINSYPVGITGSKFFVVTRSFILKMAGTIVTFELMLLEFGPIVNTEQLAFNSTYECIK